MESLNFAQSPWRFNNILMKTVVSDIQFNESISAKQMVSSTNRLHNFTSFSSFGMMIFSSSTMKMFASTGSNGEPMATPSIRIHISPLNMK